MAGPAGEIPREPRAGSSWLHILKREVNEVQPGATLVTGLCETEEICNTVQLNKWKSSSLQSVVICFARGAEVCWT